MSYVEYITKCQAVSQLATTDRNTPGNDDSKSVTGNDDSKSVTGNDDSKSVTGNDDSKSVRLLPGMTRIATTVSTGQELLYL